MAKKRPKRRSPFPVDAQKERQDKQRNQQEQDYEYTETISADDSTGGIFGYLRDIGVRETIESVVVAIVLALMFRAYEAEAFVIPTGSMAPSLQGQHMDLTCDNCGFPYRTGATGESSTSSNPKLVESTYCPVCQFETVMDRNNKNKSHNSFTGDRILVNKFIYDFQDPERYDVIVFKYPHNGKQNYIKRLVGLPGDNLLIENGDIYLMEPQKDGSYKKTITRKPSRKLRQILQAVDDTYHIGDRLKDVDWPSRWQSFGGVGNWKINEEDGNPNFTTDATPNLNWIRYRNLFPLKSEWATIMRGSKPDQYKRGRLPSGRLIDDRYAYNDFVNAGERGRVSNPGCHWVGDIGLECWIDIESNSGTLVLDLVEGGAHFKCEIDIATGKATLVCDDSKVDTKVQFESESGDGVDAPTAQTNLKGTGTYHIEYVNADDKIHLWINNGLVTFDAPNYSRTGVPIPQYSVDDPGDAEPVGIGTKNLKASISRLKVVRDIYYTSAKGRGRDTMNETRFSYNQIKMIQQNPEFWKTEDALAYFNEKKGGTKPMFVLEDSENGDRDQFLPIGDNSPLSLDGRVWDGPNYVERDMLIGRAMLIYWPHAKNKPLPVWPNFERMGFIR